MIDDRARLQHALRTGAEVIAADLSSDSIPSELVRSVLVEEAVVHEGKYLDPRGLRLTGVTLEGNLDLANMHHLPEMVLGNVTISGHLDLSNSTINGGLNIEGGAVRAQLVGTGLRVRRHVYICAVDFGYSTDEGRTFKGMILLSRATVGEYLQLLVDVDDVILSDARVGGGNSEVDGDAVIIGLADSEFGAVDLNRASFESSVRLEGSFSHGIAIRGVNVRGELDLASAQVTSWIRRGRLTDEALFVDAREAVADTFVLPRESPDSGVDLTDAKVGQLVVHVAGNDNRPVSPRIDATNGWTLESLEMINLDKRPEPSPIPRISSDEAAGLVAWLPNGGGDAFPLMAWRALASALDGEGREDEGRWLRIEAVDRHKRSTAKSVWSRAGRIITKSTIGHGYSPFRALGWLAGLWAVATALAMIAWRSSKDAFANSTDVVDPPGLWEYLYALDITISPVGSFQSEIWMPTWWWLALAFWVLKAASYALFGLFIAGITGRAMKAS
ncbi:hypothetical protein SAMN05192575_11324 [Nocardioides alpinus]|uniref:Pentapeptide repeat-containing protein n=1 Tax=Nocardioides alpinus TaxID=748909 RepID=A0A1I1B2U0_9ACTN|nr:hypothetical protein [Nocardioides alpinus]PKH40160.1 hypothetical protein CXG46_13460 [Nocardioides alpinus]SFB44664.1 hypothetical protein SAMN05192575_11324 [Nocardioides alpinus]